MRAIKFMTRNIKYLDIIILSGMSYVININTLTTTFNYYLWLVIVSVFILFSLYYLKKIDKSKLLITFIKLLFLTYSSIYSFFFIVSTTKNYEIVNVPLKGYSLTNMDAIYFRFNGYKFKKYFTLTDYPLENITSTHKVKLVLRKPVENIFFIEAIKLESLK